MPRLYFINCRVLLLTLFTVQQTGCLSGEYDDLDTDDFYFEDGDLSEIDDFLNTELDSDSNECEPAQGVRASPDVPLPSCTDSGKPYIYFTTWADMHLYAYDPEANRIDYDTEISCGSCKRTTGISASTVLGDGDLLVYFENDGLYRIDPDDMICQPTPIRASDDSPVIVTLGFVPDDNGGQLYATVNYEGVGVADQLVSIDRETFEITNISPLEGYETYNGLAGSDDGRLYGLQAWFFTGSMRWQVVDFDRQSGQVASVLFEADERDTPDAVAFAIPYTGSWWQDDLYIIGIFGPGLGGIYRVDLETDQKELVFSGIAAAAGRTTVSTFTGAGSSHCEWGVEEGG